VLAPVFIAAVLNQQPDLHRIASAISPESPTLVAPGVWLISVTPHFSEGIIFNCTVDEPILTSKSDAEWSSEMESLRKVLLGTEFVGKLSSMGISSILRFSSPHGKPVGEVRIDPPPQLKN